MLNMVIVIGKLVRPLQVRSLPSGVSLASFDLQVARAGETGETVPVALFDVADRVRDCQTGEQLLVVGRVRRRFFRVGGNTQSRTEVVAELALPLGQTDEACSALAEAGSTLASVADDLRSG